MTITYPMQRFYPSRPKKFPHMIVIPTAAFFFWKVNNYIFCSQILFEVIKFYMRSRMVPQIPQLSVPLLFRAWNDILFDFLSIQTNLWVAYMPTHGTSSKVITTCQNIYVVTILLKHFPDLRVVVLLFVSCILLTFHSTSISINRQRQAIQYILPLQL